MSEAFLSAAQKEARSIISDDRAEFSIPVRILILQQGSEAIEILTNGIFDETYEEIDPDTGAIILSKNPRVMLSRSDIEQDESGNIIVTIPDKQVNTWFFFIDGKKYIMGGRPKDGQEIIGMPLTGPLPIGTDET